MSSYLFPIVTFTVFVNILSKIINHKHTKIKKVTYSYNSLWQLLVLFVAGALPYVFMNKFSIYWSVKDWGSRHGFLLIFPTSLFTALCCQIFIDKAKSYFIKKIVLLGSVIIIVQSILLLGFSVLHKLNRQVFVTDLENLIKKIQHEIEPGLIQIIVNKIPAPQIREGYESNFLMYKATGKANFWTRIEIEENKIFTIPCEIRKNIAYQVQYIYNYDSNHLAKYNLIHLDVVGYNKLMDMIKNVFNYQSNRQIVLNSIIVKNINPKIQKEICES